jgi:hypothetical protein
MKVLKLFCFILIIGFVIPLYGQTEATLTLPRNITVSPGDSIVTPLHLSTDSSIIASQIVLEYDSTKVKFINAALGKNVAGFSIETEKNFPIAFSNTGLNQNVLLKISGMDTNKISGNEFEFFQIKWYVSGFNGNATLAFNQTSENTYLTTLDSNLISGSQIQFNAGALQILPDTTAILSLKTNLINMPVGAPFQVAMQVSDVKDLHNFEAGLEFDPAILILDSVKQGNFLNEAGAAKTSWTIPLIDNLKGEVQGIKCMRQDASGVLGGGTLTTFYFRSLNSGATQIELIQDQCRLGDPEFFSIPIASLANLAVNIFREPAIEMFISDTVAAPSRYINIPLTIQGVADFDIISALIEVKFDSSCLLGIDVINKGTLTENWQPPIVNNLGNSFYFALAGSKPLARDGVLVFLRLLSNPRATENQACDVTFSEVILNEGSPTPKLYAGKFQIRGLQIGGAVAYQGTKVPVPNANLTISGPKSATKRADENGAYNMNQLPYGNYLLKPEKLNDQGRYISPFDAALILQYVVGINQLSPYQRIAADVSGDGSVSTFDAALIMRYAVNLDRKFPVMKDSLDCWDFVPANFAINDTNWVSHPDSLSYTPLEQDQFSQDFVGIVCGDVSQNWISPGLQLNPLYKQRMFATIQFGNLKFSDAGIFEVPLHIRHTNAVHAIEIEMEFSDHEFELLNIALTDLSKEFLLSYHNKNGRLEIALAGAHPITGMGSLLDLQFKARAAIQSDLPGKLVINHAWFNEEEVYILASEHGAKTTVPQRLELSPNYPNPFNQETVFRISIPELRDSKISLVIYNLNGQIVRTLLNRNYAPGQYTIRWNGTNEMGNMIASGEYLCVLKAGRERQVQRFVLLR